MIAPSEFATKTRIPKEIRYKWLSKNAPGELKYVHKSSLSVDHTYQRDMNESKRLRIAKDFNWAAFGVLIVSRRKNGDLVVVDGQHRLGAAKSRTDIQEVPVVIFDLGDNLQDEASDFLMANQDRRALRGLETFAAQLIAGDEASIRVNELLGLADRTAGKATTGSSNTVNCVIALRQLVLTDYASLEAVWPTMVELSRKSVFDNRLIKGLVYLEQRMKDEAGEKVSISDTKIHKRFLSLGQEKLMAGIHKASSYYQGGGAKVWATGILEAFNKGVWKKFEM